MPKFALYLMLTLVFAAIASTANAYVIRRKADERPQTRQPEPTQRKSAIRDWTGPHRPATIWR